MYNQFKAERAGIHAVGRTLAHIRNDLKQAIQWCIQGDFFPDFSTQLLHGVNISLL